MVSVLSRTNTFVLLTSCALAAQPDLQPRLRVRGPEPEVARIGEQVAYTVILEDVAGPAAATATLGALPHADGLTLVAAAPAHTTVATLHAGAEVTCTTVAWRLLATPQRAGTFVLPSLAASLGGRTWTADPARLHVLPAWGGDADAFIEFSAPAPTCYLHQPITVEIRFGFARAFRAGQLVPLFMRALDLPVQLCAAWWDGLPGADAHDAARAQGAPAVSLALGDAIVHARAVGDQLRGGVTFDVFALTRTLLPTHTGELIVPGPSLRFAFATRFDDDFVHGRVAVEQLPGCVRAPALALAVKPWPTAGRPKEFTGAVGQFRLRAAAEPDVVAAGDSCKLVVRIAGDGNLHAFAAPRLDALAGFHLRGVVEVRSDHERTVTYDLAALRDDAVLPPITLPFFDPTPPGTYRTASSGPIALRIVPGTAPASSASPSPDTTPGVDDIFDLTTSAGARREPTRFSPRATVACLLAPWLLALGLALHLRARERQRRDPLGQRARAAFAAFRAAQATTGADLHAALLTYLAARLRCTEATVIGPDLEARLQAAGVPAPLAARAHAALTHGAALRYGGTQEASLDVNAVVTELERALTQAGSR